MMMAASNICPHDVVEHAIDADALILARCVADNVNELQVPNVKTLFTQRMITLFT